MDAETEPTDAPKQGASSQLKPVEPAARPQFVVLTTDAAAVGVCNLDGECS